MTAKLRAWVAFDVAGERLERVVIVGGRTIWTIRAEVLGVKSASPL